MSISLPDLSRPFEEILSFTIFISWNKSVTPWLHTLQVYCHAPHANWEMTLKDEGSVGIYGTGNPVHLPNHNPLPTCVLTNLNFRCCVFNWTMTSSISILVHFFVVSASTEAGLSARSEISYYKVPLSQTGNITILAGGCGIQQHFHCSFTMH